MNNTKDVVVDENFPGLVDGGWCWKLAGSLKAEGSLTIKLNRWLLVGEGIEAGRGIEAGEGIKAVEGIKAGWGIEAGSGIKAGDGIEAGLSISAKWVSAKLRIFAGLCMWRSLRPGEDVVRAEVRNGTVAFGQVVTPKVDAAE